jgi:putative phage-type endonuclease
MKMTRNIISYQTNDEWLRLRKKNINSTESSGLLGLSKYTTAFQIYHDKQSDDITSIEENDRMFWGSQLEWAIAQGAAQKMGWNIVQKKEYIEIPDLRIGGSFDAMFADGSALVEVKNVDGLVYRNEWLNDEAPAGIELQLQHQMLVSGINKCYLVALVGGNDLKILERDADVSIQDAILKAVSNFWSLTEAPTPDFVADADYIKSIYNKTDGTVIESEDLYELCKKYKAYAQMESEAKEQKDAIKAEILMTIGQAEKVKGSKYSISAGIVRKAEYMVKAQEYRNVRINVKE